VTESTQGKGRPTPKRSESTKRRGGPVTPPPTDRKAAAKQLRAKQADNRQKIKTGTAAGDERLMLPRDAGPIRRTVRNTVDGRRSLGFLLLPVAALLVVAQVTADPVVLAIAVGVWLATLFGVAVDLILVGLSIRSTLRAAFPQETKLRGHIAYGLLRSTVIRRFRMPRPVVQRGQKA
jgi:hypothetical protein